MDNGGYAKLEAEIGYTFKNTSFLQEALTHDSFEQGRAGSNERLEFLGDAVLRRAVAEKIFRDRPEGNLDEMSTTRNILTAGRNLSAVGDMLGIGNYMSVNQKSDLTGKTKEGAVEALIGALYLDGGPEPVRSFIERYFDFSVGHIRSPNYKGAVIDFCLSNRLHYDFHASAESGQGPWVAYSVIGEERYGPGSGRKRRQAEEDAARIACAALGIGIKDGKKNR